MNVVYPIQRLQELAAAGVVGKLTDNFYSFIGYNMDPHHLRATLAEDLADAFEEEGADMYWPHLPDRYDTSRSRWSSEP